MLDITFFGVRGSTPCSCDSTKRIGGNTSCVVVETPGGAPVILDLGTGSRYFGARAMACDEPFEATALLTHLHWDHVQGIPFFGPMLDARTKLRILGPPQSSGTLAEAVGRFVEPPLFPVALDQLPCTVEFGEVGPDTPIEAAPYEIRATHVPHCGITNGYRIDRAGGSVAYLSDHQQPSDGSSDVAPEVIELCREVDVLIHDAQYSEEEFATRSDWGHSTPAYALEVARTVGARRLVLFHHDPTHSDEWVHATAGELSRAAAQDGIEVIAAYEGLRLTSG